MNFFLFSKVDVFGLPKLSLAPGLIFISIKLGPFLVINYLTVSEIYSGVSTETASLYPHLIILNLFIVTHFNFKIEKKLKNFIVKTKIINIEKINHNY